MDYIVLIIVYQHFLEDLYIVCVDVAVFRILFTCALIEFSARVGQNDVNYVLDSFRLQATNLASCRTAEVHRVWALPDKM